MSIRKVRLTIHIDDERETMGLVEPECGYVYMGSVPDLFAAIEKRLVAGDAPEDAEEG